MPECKTCGKNCEDFKALAQHIISNKSTHHSQKWAASFVMNVQYLDQKVSKQAKLSGRVPLTEQESQNKDDARREVSGIEKNLMVFCPCCNQTYPSKIPVEFIQSPIAWRNDNKLLMVNCVNCRR